MHVGCDKKTPSLPLGQTRKDKLGLPVSKNKDEPKKVKLQKPGTKTDRKRLSGCLFWEYLVMG